MFFVKLRERWAFKSSLTLYEGFVIFLNEAGRGAAWERTGMGCQWSEVQILSPRPFAVFMLKILLTNDDGINSKGIQFLRSFLEKFGLVWVVAPEGERTGISHALSLKHPLRVKRLEDRVWAVEGTPVDCVHLAVFRLLKERPDLVVSGPNDGPNIGDEVFYSGTVAAAIEASILGIQAIAISMAPRDGHNYDTAAFVLEKLIPKLLEDPLPARTALNVNVPNIPPTELKGFKVTRLAKRVFVDCIKECLDPRGVPYYWLSGGGRFSEEEGTDHEALKAGFVSVTPLKADLTAYEEFVRISKWGLEKDL